MRHIKKVNKDFYHTLIAIALPVVAQNGISNLVNLLDNIMVGRLGTEEVAGVSIANQFIFVHTLCLFGILSGPGVFTAQYHGANDLEGVRQSVRFKLYAGTLWTFLAMLILKLFGPPLVSAFIYTSTDNASVEATLQFAIQYLHIVMIGLPLFMVAQIYSSTLGECEQTFIPMVASTVAVIVNLILNYSLIFGRFGLPALGVAGAAWATVAARLVEASFLIVWTHTHTKQQGFAKTLYSSLQISPTIIRKIASIGFPLLLNEILWSGGMTELSQCYSTRGIDSITGYNIATSLNNFFKIVLVSMGTSTGIIIGKLLGANRLNKAFTTAKKLVFVSVGVCVATGIMLAVVSPLFPKIYAVSEKARRTASLSILIYAVFMPCEAFKNTIYYTIRSGGRTWITLLYDGAFTWIISIPIAFVLSRYTNLSTPWIFFFVYCGDFLKVALGYHLAFIRKEIWLKKMIP